MAPIVIRGLDEAVMARLTARAKEHGRSLEAVVRDILTRAARRPHIGVAIMRAVQVVGGIEDLNIPVRDEPAPAAGVS